jgi:SAM-dependent methyltransferase
MPMPYVSDPKWVATQYRDTSNLEARIRLHALYSTNPYGFHRWIFDQFDLPTGCRILELGCGDGTLWRLNMERVAPGWEITLSDRSPGILRAAWRDLSGSPADPSFAVVDAQEIPFPERTFDAVIANHMLYHVPDRPRALSEIHRVLKPGGQLYASTVGQSHLRELDGLECRAQLGHQPRADPIAGSFLLENGEAQLADRFADIRISRYPDALVVTKVQPLVEYILSGTRSSSAIDGVKLAALTDRLERRLALEGAIYITKDSGIFTAIRPDDAPPDQGCAPGEQEAGQ